MLSIGLHLLLLQYLPQELVEYKTEIIKESILDLDSSGGHRDSVKCLLGDNASFVSGSSL